LWKGSFSGYSMAGGAYGGAIYSETSTVSLLNSSIARNSVSRGEGVTTTSREARGSSIAIAGGTATQTNTLLYCLPGQTNVWGAIVDGGHNLCSDDSANLSAPTSRSSVDPMLGPLGYHGGLTPTISPLPGSPAIDAGDDSVAPPTDQRGVPRPKGLASDVGAFELAPQLALSAAQQGRTIVNYIFKAGETNQVSISTNLFDWTALGRRVADANGTFVIEQVSLTDSPTRFYKVGTEATR
jgi:hypothetical protein